jgi:hypothetical protein
MNNEWENKVRAEWDCWDNGRFGHLEGAIQIIDELLTKEREEGYVIRKTKPKKGRPEGAYVCFNHSIDKYRQTFGNTPMEALSWYVHPTPTPITNEDKTEEV